VEVLVSSFGRDTRLCLLLLLLLLLVVVVVVLVVVVVVVVVVFVFPLGTFGIFLRSAVFIATALQPDVSPLKI
jgi:hypothetical protein